MKYLKIILTLQFIVAFGGIGMAQIAEHVDVESEPVGFFASTFNIFAYVLLPIFLVVGGIIYFRFFKRK